jgi:hypothetical protein
MKQLIKANGIARKWCAVNVERQPWVITLTDGRSVQILCPLGAAVEIEEKGISITGGWL